MRVNISYSVELEEVPQEVDFFHFRFRPEFRSRRGQKQTYTSKNGPHMKYLEEIQDQKVAYYYSLPFGQNGLPKTLFRK